MFYLLNNFVFIRKIGDCSLILDKITENRVIGDSITFLFLKHLSYEPKDEKFIINEICDEFNPKPDYMTVKEDFIRLVDNFIKLGYISKGKSKKECLQNSFKFSYKLCDLNFPSSYKYKVSNDNIDRFSEPFLQSVMIEITKECNERCLHCYIPHKDKILKIKDEDFFNIIDQCSKIPSLAEIEITGGECMTHPSFNRFIKYVKDHGFALSVLSNLTLLNDETVKILAEGTLSHVQTTVFSLNPKIHDKITTINGSLQKTLQNIDILKENQIPVHVATQMMEFNKDSIEKLFDFIIKNKFKLCCDWTISAQENGDISNLNLRVKNIEDYKSLCLLKIKYDKKFKHELKELTQKPLRNPECVVCNAGMNKLQIGADLKVHACAGWERVIGDLNNSTLMEIWEKSNELKKIRNIRIKDFGKCSTCNKRNICLICPAMANCEGNEFRMPEYICKMQDVIHREIENIMK